MTQIPILDMLSITAGRCAALYPGGRAALLGTTGTLQTGLYNAAMEEAGVPVLLPEPEEQAWLMHLIYDIVKATRPMQPEEQNWSRLLADLRGRGADYFILACTELPIVANTLPDEGPFIDPTAELAREAILFCGYELKESAGE
jgi:aspartate racemase